MRWSVESVLSIGITVLVAGIGGAAGFTHTHDAAAHYGQHGWLAWADAVVIECAAVVAGLRIKADRLAGTSIVFPAAVLVVAVIGQMAAQVSQAPKSLAGWLFAATPAIGFLIVIKLLMLGASPAASGEPASETAPAVDVEPVAEAEPEPAPRALAAVPDAPQVVWR